LQDSNSAELGTSMQVLAAKDLLAEVLGEVGATGADEDEI
jgi:hypothetical protein